MTTPHVPESTAHEPSEVDLLQTSEKSSTESDDARPGNQDPSAELPPFETARAVARVRQPSDRPVAVVTGAARRVGREIALAMAARGLAVVIHHGTSAVEESKQRAAQRLPSVLTCEIHERLRRRFSKRPQNWAK